MRQTGCGLLGAVALSVISLGCAALGRPGEASSYVIVDSLVAASGAEPDRLGGSLGSDVVTLVNQSIGGTQVRVPTVFEDLAQVRFRLAMKDPKAISYAVNAITMNRYRVVFRRADGRNTPGVDVPYGFDGAMTATVAPDGTIVSFTLVRTQAKGEAPLLALIGNGGAMAITTLAEITFWGTDQAGREVVANASISVTFADWGDPV
jgi:hypothetical protein